MPVSIGNHSDQGGIRLRLKGFVHYGIMIAIIMLGSTLVLLEAGGETWTQTSASDYETGTHMRTTIEDGSLRLELEPVVVWSDDGEAQFDNFGRIVANAGDVNGDGYDDTIVGIPLSDANGLDSGKVCVYHGSGSGSSLSPDWTATGEKTLDNFGFVVAAAGDVNGDGYDEILVGAPFNDEGGLDAGKVYLAVHTAGTGSSSALAKPPCR